jgi:hypothetical protein
VHPFVGAAWKAVSVALTVVHNQANLDENIETLIHAMDMSCEEAKEAAPLKDHDERTASTVKQILKQVTDCAEFIQQYCKDGRFGA